MKHATWYEKHLPNVLYASICLLTLLQQLNSGLRTIFTLEEEKNSLELREKSLKCAFCLNKCQIEFRKDKNASIMLL